MDEPLASGQRIGSYEIVDRLGAGGMGEVYRARDVRLGRTVALKVLRSGADPELLHRLDREARAASALNHPNIVHIYDVGVAASETGNHYVVMEHVEGETLRRRLARGPLPMPELLDLGAQLADGLAKAHRAGIVHRDLKPENLMVSSDGFVKILDFGLAKLTEDKTGEASEALTAAGPQTASGVVLGTVSYMSPEQARAAPLDFRSDQFTFGTILYEMLTGKRAFGRANAVDTLSAILHDEPEPVGSLRLETPTALRWLVERCLAKEPDERYASTRDLARDLSMLRDRLSESGVSEPTTVRRRKTRPLLRLAAALGAAALLVLGGLLIGKQRQTPLPTFRQLTFRQGTIRSARFSPDGQTVVYGAALGGRPIEVFTLRPGTFTSRPLGVTDANVLAVSSSGEMALQLRSRDSGYIPGTGMLARMPLEGGAAPREVLEGVTWADWSPDGSALAIVRNTGARHRLEYPVGKVLYETVGWISHPRVSPDGTRVAFIDHPLAGDDRGSIGLVGPDGRRTLGGAWSRAWGLAWAPGGNEIWFTAAKIGGQSDLRAISLSGKERTIARLMAMLNLHDIARDGRVLLARENVHFSIRALPPGAKEERELDWLDYPGVSDLSPDGRRILFFESGEGGGEGYSVYVRGTDGSAATFLGPGRMPRFSPDGRWALAAEVNADPPQLVLLPTGPGEPVRVTRDRLRHSSGQFMPDGKRIVYEAGETRQGWRLYIQDVFGGAPQPISSDEMMGGDVGPVSPDGRFVLAEGSDGVLKLYPTTTGSPRLVPGIGELDFPIQWSADGKSLYVVHWGGSLPRKVFRIDVESGKRELWKEFAPSDPTGVVDAQVGAMTPDASAYAYNYVRILSDLYLAEGLR